jgi:bifunctional non-homologous end joining protein LigD
MKRTVQVRTDVEQPTVLKPMLATLVKQPFTDTDFVFEVKWDGYRIIAFCKNGNVKLQSRGGEDYTRKYPSIAAALKSLSVNCILDGEVVYLNATGKPDFDALQRVNGQKAPVVYYAFDLLWLEGENLMNETLLERKARLKTLLSENKLIRYSDHFDDGLVLFEHVKNVGLEGVVAKRKDSKYIPDERGKKWLKVATEQRQEFVIGGWVESEKRNTFRTLLFGSYENGKLKWKGHAGGGYKEKDLPVILKRLKALEVKESPFDSDVEYSEGTPHWVKPELVANIKFATTTRSGKIRKPAIFLGFRDDKRANQVRTEIANEPPKGRILKPEKSGASKDEYQTDLPGSRKPPTSSDSNWPEVEREPVRNQEEFEIDECSITLHNVDRELWKGIKKADLIMYYHGVSKYLLPHLRDRPLSLHVKPKGPNAPGLYIKDMEGRAPACAAVFSTPRKHRKHGKRDVIDYLVCNNAATLLYAIDLGCIDVNPWTARTAHSQEPDFIVIDLDPSDNDFSKAVDAALAAKDLFDKLKIKSFVKTSGKTGMHLFLPCRGFTFPQARTIAEHLCNAIHELVPAITTTELTVSDRGNKLYLDPNQNDYADTVASAYSVRPFKHPNVSAPLDWREVKTLLTPEDFTITNMLKRLEKKNDLFMGVLDERIAHKNSRVFQNMLKAT